MAHLTPVLMTALKAGVVAVPAANAMMVAGDVSSLAEWLNAPTTVAAWRAQVPGSDIYAAHKPQEYIARSAAERSAFDLMCGQARIDATNPAIRLAVVDIFSGGANSTSRAAILTAMTEFATNAENILGGTAATTSGVTALVRTWPGRVTIEEANRLPHI